MQYEIPRCCVVFVQQVIDCASRREKKQLFIFGNTALSTEYRVLCRQ